MSSQSDKFVVEESLDDQDYSSLFQSKKWTYITDSSSVSGAFNGQIQFDLNTLSSQAQWVDLSQAIIQFPVKISINNKSGTFTGNTATALAATIKNGFHQFVDSVQIVVGNQTVQTSQIFTNILTNYKIISGWSNDSYQKYKDVLGLGLDDVTMPSDKNMVQTDSLDNAAVPSVVYGFDIQNSKNQGIKQRLQSFNNDTQTGNLGRKILGTNQPRLGKANVQYGTSTTLGDDIFVAYAIGTIRLKDISDFCDKMPVTKNLKGFIYVNYNAATSDYANNGNATVTTVTNSSLYGRCQPANLAIRIAANEGFQFGSGTGTVSMKAEVSAVKSTILTTADTIMTNARLLCPVIIAAPEIDRVLVQKKTFRYNETFVTQFNIDKSGSFTGTLTPGISNPKRIILYPYFTGAGDSGATFLSNPLLSASDSVPSTTSPFAAIKDLQITVGNNPLLQNPITYDFENWLEEISQTGLDGGQSNQLTSGLLNYRQWNQLYRYYTFDLSRRLDSEDGASKSIQITCNNATVCPMTVIAFILYEKEVTMDTGTGMVITVR